MFSFRAIIDENAIVDYVNTLILPPYMSYLKREPFHFKEQVHNATGRESLHVYYTEEGRLEEILLYPEKHAIPLLASLPLGLDPDKIAISKDAVWLWTKESCNEFMTKPTYDKKEDEHSSVMSLFFHPTAPLLNSECKDTFDARLAYISVSKQILYIDLSVVRRYILERISTVLLPHSILQKKMFCNLTTENQLLKDFNINLMIDGFRFVYGKLAGELIFDSYDLFRDLVHFAKLDLALKSVEDYIQFNWKEAVPRLSLNGIFFEPVCVKNKCP